MLFIISILPVQHHKIIIMRKFLLLHLLLISGLSASAQKFLTGRIADFITNTSLTDSITSIELLRPDSTVVTGGSVFAQSNKGKQATLFYVKADKEGDYLLRVKNPDYHTLYHPVHVRFYRRENSINIGRLQMRRKMADRERHLSEATVTATRIKFYFDKDTLVYNASAFITQEGFVLSDIMAKMPGITVEPDGEIYSNGRKVETMLLNGKDFFDSDRQTLMENLPAFMVKSVSLYNKDKDSTSVFRRERDMEGLVMDIRLKPEYHSVIVGNTDLAAGTDRHYYGRLFAMQIHDLHRWSVYAGANDVNRNEEVNRDGQWRNIDNGSGDKDFWNAGINYNVDDRRGRYALDGKLRVQGSRELNTLGQTSQLFYRDGDVFAQNSNDVHTRNFSIQTEHNFLLFNNSPLAFSIRPAFTYIHSRQNAEQLYGQFSQNVTDRLGSAWRDSLRTAEWGETLHLYGINRMAWQSEKPVDFTQGKLEIQKTIDIPHSNDRLDLTAGGFYSRNESEEFGHRTVDYRTPASRIFRNTYQHILAENRTWNAAASYLCRIDAHHSVTAGVKYEHIENKTDDAFFNLHCLGTGWDAMAGSAPLGELPSQSDLLRTLDAGNSKWFSERADIYRPELAYAFEKGVYNLKVAVPLNAAHRHLDFRQADRLTGVSRSLLKPDVNIRFFTWLRGHTGYNFSADYSLEHALPALIYLVDQRNDANPLFVYLGNPGLKNSVTHLFRGNVYWAPRTMHNHLLSLTYRHLNGAVAMQTDYDRSSGKYTYMPRNVNGNRSLGFFLQNAMFLTADFRHKLTSKCNVTLGKSVDYSGADEHEASCRSVVHNYRISEELTYGFTLLKTKLRGEVTPYFVCHHSTSDRLNFNPIHAYDFGARIGLQLELPASVRLASDLRSVSRRGYNTHEMNDDEFIWNATLSKSFSKGITISAEAFDILGQFKNVLHYVNAQSRTESIVNHLRRHAMIHLVWQFNKRKH